MRGIWVAAAALAVMMPGVAAAEGWRHALSGVSIADLPRGLSRGQVTNNHGGADVYVQLGTQSEPVTFYVYRSAYPNAALWFERTRLAMNVNIGSGEARVAPRSFTLGDSPAPNGLREEIALPEGTGLRSTAVAIAQYGEWIVKVRITSRSLDRQAIGAKMDGLLAAIRLPGAVPPPNPLIVPPLCPDENRMNGRLLGSGDLAAQAGPALRRAAAEARGRGGLAADPEAWCRERSSFPTQYGTIYRQRDGRAWTTLLSDAGIGVSAYQIDLPDADGAATFAANPAMTGLVQVFDHLPAPETATDAAILVLVGRAQPVSRLDAGRR